MKEDKIIQCKLNKKKNKKTFITTKVGDVIAVKISNNHNQLITIITTMI